MWGGVVDRIENEIFQLCTDFLFLLEELKRKKKISEVEFESHTRLKNLFIHQEKSKLSV